MPSDLTVADTAFATAAVRARESALPEAERLFDDPYAKVFDERGSHAAEGTQRFMSLPFFRDGVRLRTRFIDDFVQDGLASGLQQLVVFGAGFDSRGIRMREISAHRVSVFEIDSPEQLERKRRMLVEAGVKLPSTLSFVPFEFDAAAGFENALLTALAAKGFRSGTGAIFVWEGVIPYLDDSAIDSGLRFMVSAGGPRSRVVFTYSDGRFSPETAAVRAQRAGFTTCEEFGSDVIWRRYLRTEPSPRAWFSKIGVATV